MPNPSSIYFPKDEPPKPAPATPEPAGMPVSPPPVSVAPEPVVEPTPAPVEPAAAPPEVAEELMETLVPTQVAVAEISQADMDEATRAMQGIDVSAEDPMAEAIRKEISLGTSSVQQERAGSLDAPLAAGEVFRSTNLTKAYGSGAAYSEVIKGVSFSVFLGEYVVITGPSGSGKSTLLHMLAGLEVPSRGQIRLRNQVLHDFTDNELALYHREEIGLVFQNFNLLESLRVWENVAFPLMISGAPIEWRQHEAMKVLDRFNMVDFANHYPNQLSGGQQQRVAMARALVHDPEIIMFDEPTGNLDSASTVQVLKEIERLHKQEERTIIVVTHSRVFLPYATRVFYIQDGTLLTSNDQSRLNSDARSALPGVERAAA